MNRGLLAFAAAWSVLVSISAVAAAAAPCNCPVPGSWSPSNPPPIVVSVGSTTRRRDLNLSQRVNRQASGTNIEIWSSCLTPGTTIRIFDNDQFVFDQSTEKYSIRNVSTYFGSNDIGSITILVDDVDVSKFDPSNPVNLLIAPPLEDPPNSQTNPRGTAFIPTSALESRNPFDWPGVRSMRGVQVRAATDAEIRRDHGGVLCSSNQSDREAVATKLRASLRLAGAVAESIRVEQAGDTISVGSISRLQVTGPFSSNPSSPGEIATPIVAIAPDQNGPSDVTTWAPSIGSVVASNRILGTVTAQGAVGDASNLAKLYSIDSVQTTVGSTNSGIRGNVQALQGLITQVISVGEIGSSASEGRVRIEARDGSQQIRAAPPGEAETPAYNIYATVDAAVPPPVGVEYFGTRVTQNIAATGNFNGSAKFDLLEPAFGSNAPLVKVSGSWIGPLTVTSGARVGSVLIRGDVTGNVAIKSLWDSASVTIGGGVEGDISIRQPTSGFTGAVSISVGTFTTPSPNPGITRTETQSLIGNLNAGTFPEPSFSGILRTTFDFAGEVNGNITFGRPWTQEIGPTSPRYCRVNIGGALTGNFSVYGNWEDSSIRAAEFRQDVRIAGVLSGAVVARTNKPLIKDNQYGTIRSLLIGRTGPGGTNFDANDQGDYGQTGFSGLDFPPNDLAQLLSFPGAEPAIRPTQDSDFVVERVVKAKSIGTVDIRGAMTGLDRTLAGGGVSASPRIEAEKIHTLKIGSFDAGVIWSGKFDTPSNPLDIPSKTSFETNYVTLGTAVVSEWTDGRLWARGGSSTDFPTALFPGLSSPAANRVIVDTATKFGGTLFMPELPRGLVVRGAPNLRPLPEERTQSDVDDTLLSPRCPVSGECSPRISATTLLGSYYSGNSAIRLNKSVSGQPDPLSTDSGVGLAGQIVFLPTSTDVASGEDAVAASSVGAPRTGPFGVERGQWWADVTIDDILSGQ